jgi:hypothetical protein
MTATTPVIPYNAIIEAALDGTPQRAHVADERAAAGSTTLRKTGFIPGAAAILAGPSMLVNQDEANLPDRQARQRAEHAARMVKTGGIEVNIGDVQKRAQVDADAKAVLKANRLRQITPGFLARIR